MAPRRRAGPKPTRQTTHAPDLDLVHDLQDLHDSICQMPTGVALRSIEGRFARAARDMRALVATGSISAGSASTCYQLFQGIRVLSSSALAIEKINKAARRDVISRAEEILETPRNCGGRKDLSSPSTHCEVPDYLPWKSWFLEHLHHPYPDEFEAEALVAAIPGMTQTKFRNWMTNNRRRTGWNDLFKRWAGSNREKLRKLLEKVDDPVACLTVDEDARKAVVRVRSHFAELDKAKVVDPALDDLIQRHKATPAKRKHSVEPPLSSPTSSTFSERPVSLRSPSGSSFDSSSSALTFASSPSSASSTPGTPPRQLSFDWTASTVTPVFTTDDAVPLAFNKPSLYAAPNRPASTASGQQPSGSTSTYDVFLAPPAALPQPTPDSWTVPSFDIPIIALPSMAVPDINNDASWDPSCFNIADLPPITPNTLAFLLHPDNAPTPQQHISPVASGSSPAP